MKDLLSELRDFQKLMVERKDACRTEEDEATEINDWETANNRQIKAVTYHYISMRLDKILSKYEVDLQD
jgi:hypothetical protein